MDRWFPFNKDALFISFKLAPIFYLKENESVCKLNFTISLSNHTDYDITVKNIETRIILNDFRLLNLEKIVWKEIKIKQNGAIDFEKALTQYEVKKAFDLFRNYNAINGILEYEITLENILSVITVKGVLENRFEIIK